MQIGLYVRYRGPTVSLPSSGCCVSVLFCLHKVLKTNRKIGTHRTGGVQDETEVERMLGRSHGRARHLGPSIGRETFCVHCWVVSCVVNWCCLEYERADEGLCSTFRRFEAVHGILFLRSEFSKEGPNS